MSSSSSSSSSSASLASKFPPRPRNEAAFAFLRKLGGPRHYVCAPMVEGSELPFRMLVRKYGTNLCYTPMIHAKIFLNSNKAGRRSIFSTCPEDRPLVAQFCANDPDELLGACRLLEHVVDAVDINLGCPQRIAKNGNYGAFLLEQPDIVMPMVKALAENLKVPVWCKIRSLGSVESTVRFARALEDHGCTLVTVHGRTKEMKRTQEGLADWDLIRAVRESVGVPVFSNGNVRDYRDAVECLEATGCEGVMSAIGLLRNPRLFEPALEQKKKEEDMKAEVGGGGDGGGDGRVTDPVALGRAGFCGSEDRQVLRPCPIEMALEYLDFAERYPTHGRMPRGHIFWLVRDLLNAHVDLRFLVSTAQSIEDYRTALTELRDRVINGKPGPKEMPEELKVMSKRKIREAHAERKRKRMEEAHQALKKVDLGGEGE